MLQGPRGLSQLTPKPKIAAAPDLAHGARRVVSVGICEGGHRSLHFVHCG
jgi:hypothetical protein